MAFSGRSSRFGSQCGFTLIELLVGLAILGFIAPVALMALSTNTRAVQITGEKTQAEALIRSQIEYIQSESYLPCDPTPCYALISGGPYQYSINLDVEILDSSTCVEDNSCNTLQKLTAWVTRPSGEGMGRTILSISAYKVKM